MSRRPAHEWDLFFQRMACNTAELSKDPHRKVGAVLVAPGRRQFSLGFNGFPAEIEDTAECLADPDFRRVHMVHAEDNCLRQAPFATAGSALYVTRYPCEGCAAKLIAAGVARLVAPRADFHHPRWGQSWFDAACALSEAGVQVDFWRHQP